MMIFGTGANAFFFTMSPEALRAALLPRWAFTDGTVISPTDDITLEDAPAPDEDTTPESPKSDPVPEDAETAGGMEPAP